MILVSVWSLEFYSANNGKMGKQISFHAEHHEAKIKLLHLYQNSFRVPRIWGGYFKNI